METRPKSQVWIVNLEQQGLGGGYGKYSKQLSSEYEPGQKSAILFPVGYVIKHPDNQGAMYQDFGGFQKQSDIVARAIYDGVDISHLEGELLTVMDAAFTDKQQCEAIKSLVRNTIWKFNANQVRKVEEIFKSA
jgi:hypothetical protein